MQSVFCLAARRTNAGRRAERPAPRRWAKDALHSVTPRNRLGAPRRAALFHGLGRHPVNTAYPRLLPIIVAFAIVSQAFGSAGGMATVVAGMSLWLGVMLMVMGPQMMRNDLRQDLTKLEMLKTWPVTGAAIVRGEVLAPSIAMSVVIWLLLLVAAMFGGRVIAWGNAPLPILDLLSYVTAAMILVPPIILAQTVLLNGVAVVLPAWSSLGSTRARGIDAMGQRLLMLAGILLTLVLSLLPGAAAAAALMAVVYWLTGVLLVVIPALLVAFVVIVECWVATELLGRVLDYVLGCDVPLAAFSEGDFKDPKNTAAFVYQSGLGLTW